PVALTVIDLTTSIFSKNNEQAIKLFKFSDEELKTKGSPADISPEFQPDGRRSEEKAIEFLTKALNDEKPVFEWVFCNGDGKNIVCEVSLVKLSNATGSLLLASSVDITEREKAKKEIREL